MSGSYQESNLGQKLKHHITPPRHSWFIMQINRDDINVYVIIIIVILLKTELLKNTVI